MTVSAAVEATLTSIAASENEDNAPISPTPTPEPPAFAPSILPPLVDNFAPAPRPASSQGDPNAPVVIYEWSDYT